MPAQAGIQYTLWSMEAQLWWLAAVRWLLDHPLEFTPDLIGGGR